MVPLGEVVTLMSGFWRHRRQILGRQLPGDVDVALLQQQPLGGGLGDVPGHDALELGRTAPVVGVAVQRHALVGLPCAQLEGARAGGVGLEPLVAHVAVLLVLLDELHVDHRADAGGQAVEQEGRRVGLVEREHERAVVRGLDRLGHVLGREPELGQDEARRQIELDHALHGVGDVVRGQRVAGVELDPGADLERHLQPVVRHAPALGDQALELADVVGRIGHQPVVDLGLDLGCRELEHLGRVEADHVVDEVGQHQAVLGRLRAQRRRADSQRHQRRAEAQPEQLAHPPCPPLLYPSHGRATSACGPFLSSAAGAYGAGEGRRQGSTACNQIRLHRLRQPPAKVFANRLLTSRATWHVCRHVRDQDPVDPSTIFSVGDVDRVTPGAEVEQ